MKRKSFVVSTVVVLIIVIVIILAAFGMLRVFRQWARESEDKLNYDYGSFEPFAVIAQEEDNTVDNSVKGLICAIRMTASLAEKEQIFREEHFAQQTIESEWPDYFRDEINWKELWNQNCPDSVQGVEGQLIPEEAGSACINAGGVCTNEISTHINAEYKEASFDPSNPDNIERCPEALRYCELMCVEHDNLIFQWEDDCEQGYPEGYQMCEGEGAFRAAKICMPNHYFCQRICQCAVEHDKVLCIEGSDESFVEDELRRIAQSAQEQYFEHIREINGLVSCSDGVLYGSTCVRCELFENSFKCHVKNFELPQTLEGEGFLDKWIAGFGDPQYIVYYEAFPAGEEQFWQPDYLDYHPLMVYGSSFLSLILPADSDMIEAASTVRSVRGLMRLVSEHSLAGKIVGTLFRLPSKILSFKRQLTFIRLGLRNPEHLARLQQIEGKIHSSLFLELADELDGEFIDTSSLIFILNKRIQPGLSRLSRTELDELAEELTEFFSVRLPNDLVQDAVDLSISQIRQGLTASVDVQEMNLFQRFISLRNQARRIEDVLADHVDKVKRLDAIEEMAPYIDETQIQKLSKAVENAGSDKSIIFNEILEASAKAEQAPASLLSSIYEKMPRIIRYPLSSAKWLSRTALSAPTKRNRFFTMAFLFYIGNLTEQINDKFFPHGVNTVIVKQANLLGVSKNYELGDNLRKYVVFLQNEGEESDNNYRFYFASPCSADIELTRETLAYNLDDQEFILKYDLYDFGTGLMPVSKATLNYDIIPREAYAEGLRIEDCTLSEETAKIYSKKGGEPCPPDMINLINYHLNEIGHNSVSSSTRISQLYEYAQEQFNSALSLQDSPQQENTAKTEAFWKALKIFTLITEFFPNSVEAKNSALFIDIMLFEPRIFTRFHPTKLKEIFEPFVLPEDRAKYYSWYFESAFADENSKLYDNRKGHAHLSLLMPPPYCFANMNCEAYGGCYNLPNEDLGVCDKYADHNIKSVNFLLMLEEHPDLNLNEYYSRMYVSMLSDIKNEIYDTYFEPLTYIYPHLYNQLYGESGCVNVNDPGFDTPHDEAGYCTRAAVSGDVYIPETRLYAQDRFNQESYEERYNEFMQHLEYLYELKEDDFARYVWMSDVDRIFWEPSTGHRFGPYKGSNAFALGMVWLPKHLKYSMKAQNSRLMPKYPNYIYYKNQVVSKYEEIERDTDYTDDNVEELYVKKQYYEEKAKALTITDYYDDVWREDYLKWEQINERLNQEGIIDSSFAVKEVFGTNIVNEYPALGTLTSSGIMIKANLKDKEPNYCYQSHEAGLQNQILFATALSIFVDDLVSTIAAGACAGATLWASGGTATTGAARAAAYCYKGASFFTNLAFANYERGLRQRTKWPKRGI